MTDTYSVARPHTVINPIACPNLPRAGAAMITYFTSHEATVGDMKALSPEDFVTAATTYETVDMDEMRRRFPNLSATKLADKAKQGAAVLLAWTKDNRKTRGCALWRNMLALDVDGTSGAIAPPPQSLKEKLTALNASYALHTTFKHAVEKPRYRIYIWLDQPIDLTTSTGRYQAAVKRIAEKLGVLDALDPASWNHNERLMYVPRRPSGGPEPYTAFDLVADDITEADPAGRLVGVDFAALVDDVPLDAPVMTEAPDDLVDQGNLSADLASTRALLASIDQTGERGPDRDKWLDIGRAVWRIHGDEGFPLFQEFSARHPTHDEAELTRTWASLTNTQWTERQAHSVLSGAAMVYAMPDSAGMARLRQALSQLRPPVDFFRPSSGTPRGRGRPSLVTPLLTASRRYIEAIYYAAGTRDIYVDELSEGVRRTFPLRSAGYRALLSARSMRLNNGRAATRMVIDQTLDTMAAMALSAPPRPVHLRFAHEDGVSWADMGDDSWRAIRIGREGWRIEASTEVPVRFRRADDFGALPEPVQANDAASVMTAFQKIVPLSKPDLSLVFANLTLALSGRPVPNAILPFVGGPGAAKTTAMNLIRRLIDPVAVLSTAPFKEERDAVIAARNNAIVCIDNISRMNEDQQNHYCRLVTGAGFSSRMLYTDGDVFSMFVRRPIMMTGLGSFITRGDLADRSLTIELPSIEANNRLLEEVVEKAFQELWSKMLGLLLDGVVSGLRGEETRPANLPRLADYFVWGRAACAAYDTADNFEKAFKATRQAQADAMLGDDPMLQAVIKLFEVSPAEAVPSSAPGSVMSALAPMPGTFTFQDGTAMSWSGTPAALLAVLTRLQFPHGNTPSTWPRVPRLIRLAVLAHQPTLDTLGIRLDAGRTTPVRVIELTRQARPTQG